MIGLARRQARVFTIDHFDDNDLAVLESSSESLIVPRAFLPSGAKEGDVLSLEQRQSETETRLHFTRNVSATEAVLESASALRANLKRAPERKYQANEAPHSSSHTATDTGCWRAVYRTSSQGHL